MMVDLFQPPSGELTESWPQAPAAADRGSARAPREPAPPAPTHDPPPLLDLEPVLRESPPWLASAIFHMALMIVLGLLLLSSEAKYDLLLDAGYSDDVGDPILEEPELVTGDFELDDELLTPQNLPVVEDPFATPDVQQIAPNPVLATGPVVPTTIGVALTGREPGMKEALLKAYGGTSHTEGAVALGLRWLANRQKRDGLWSLSGPYADGSRANNEAAATAMALLAFQGAGYTPQSDPQHAFTTVVRRGWNAMLKMMDDDGRFFHDVPTGHQLYTQAQCTIALCELFAMTGDYQYRDAAQKAVDYCVKIQANEGGWRYNPGSESDMSVTGWFVMALQSARMAGLDVPSPTLDRVNDFLNSVARDEGTRYAYRAQDGATLALTAEGLLCRQYLGWEHNDPRLQAGVAYLLDNLPDWNQRNVYYWYYATQVLHHMEDSPWRIWNAEMRKLLPEKQVKRGRERGSWDPGGDRWGGEGGRLYVTCLSIYILEVYYRHLPLYQTGILGGGY
jgi:hypothetical protein